MSIHVEYTINESTAYVALEGMIHLSTQLEWNSRAHNLNLAQHLFNSKYSSTSFRKCIPSQYLQYSSLCPIRKVSCRIDRKRNEYGRSYRWVQLCSIRAHTNRQSIALSTETDSITCLYCTWNNSNSHKYTVLYCTTLYSTIPYSTVLW